ncbi:MAG: HAMP domain-containing histidine kinase [Clostridia bacterium]|nr:HAMP domain-containing histidine kinase [Clostridia bacterium]
MRSREAFETIRNRKKDRFSLRTRMILMVQLELLACVGLTYLLDLLAYTLEPNWKFPLFWELVIVSMLVGTVATYFASKLFFNPMKKLRQAMDQVANGDLSVQLDPKESSSGEVQELYAGFNLMTHELRATQVLQTDFVSNVSHEFKTPINAIEGYTTLLQGTDNIDETENEYIEKILFNTRRLSSLVSNILLLSKLENQSIQTDPETYSLDEQIREDLLSLESAWEPKAIEFDVELEAVSYHGNRGIMHHVWSNLLSNAVKFSPVGGVIRIRLQTVQDRIVFTVEDQGPGLSEEALKHLFDRFYQGDTSHKEEGNGLGLALVKNILSLCGGQAVAENIQTGGCRFTVTLPCKESIRPRIESF